MKRKRKFDPAIMTVLLAKEAQETAKFALYLVSVPEQREPAKYARAVAVIDRAARAALALVEDALRRAEQILHGPKFRSLYRNVAAPEKTVSVRRRAATLAKPKELSRASRPRRLARIGHGRSRRGGAS